MLRRLNVRRAGRSRVIVSGGGGSPPPPAWSPTDRGDLLFWFRADQNVTHTANRVDIWGDSSPNGYDVTPVVTREPLLVSNVINGHPVIRFSSSNIERLSRSSLGGSAKAQPLTIYSVLYTISGVAGQWYDGFVSGGRIMGQSQSSDVPRIFAGSFVSGTTARGNVFAGYSAVYNGASSAIYAQNFTTAEGTGNPGSNALDGLVIGSNQAQSSTFFNGDIAELIAFESADDQTARNQVRDYLNDRYNLSIT